LLSGASDRIDAKELEVSFCICDSKLVRSTLSLLSWIAAFACDIPEIAPNAMMDAAKARPFGVVVMLLQSLQSPQAELVRRI